jgi:hypothetical protein
MREIDEYFVPVLKGQKLAAQNPLVMGQNDHIDWRTAIVALVIVSDGAHVSPCGMTG